MLKVAGGNLTGALQYQGTWNASTNTPTLVSGVGIQGAYYVVSVAGSTNLDGTTLWGVGDWAVFNGSIWQKVDGGSTGNFTSITVDANSSTDAVRITQTGSGNALLVEDSTNPDATPFVVDATGVVLIGTATKPAFNTHTLQQHGAVSAASSFTQGSWGINASFGVENSRLRSLSGAIGTQTAVTNGTVIGRERYYGDDGTTFIEAAQIQVLVDGTPGTNDMPGRLAFLTTADGASTPTERMRISSAGYVGIGATAASPANGLTRFGQSFTGNVNVNGVFQAGVIQSDVTSGVNGFYSALGTAAASFTLGSLSQYSAGQSSFGAGSSVTNQFGFRAESSLTGATNNYGFYGNIASGTGRWNFYANGTAPNYFEGNVTSNATITSKQAITTNNAVTVTANAGTVPVTSKLNTFTNSSAAAMTITLTTTNAVDGQQVMVRIYDFSNVAQTITWVNTENSLVTAPTTSNGSTTLPLTVGFMYNAATSKWRCIAFA